MSLCEPCQAQACTWQITTTGCRCRCHPDPQRLERLHRITTSTWRELLAWVLAELPPAEFDNPWTSRRYAPLSRDRLAGLLLTTRKGKGR